MLRDYLHLLYTYSDNTGALSPAPHRPTESSGWKLAIVEVWVFAHGDWPMLQIQAAPPPLLDCCLLKMYLHTTGLKPLLIYHSSSSDSSLRT